MRRAQQGVTVVLVAITLAAVCGMGALALDVGVLFAAKNSAQNAADAGALAGAFTFLNPAAVQPAAAQTAAVALANANAILGQPVQIDSSNVSVDIANQMVTVTVPRTGSNGIQTFFARVFGVTHADVLATASGQTLPWASGTGNLRPLFVPNTILSTLDPGAACMASPPQTILDSQGNLTTFARSQIGAALIMRPTSPSGSLLPGQFYSLDFGNGAQTYSCALSSSLTTCGITPGLAICGNSYPTENGNMVGPTTQGINALVGSSPDIWEAPGAYLHPDGTITDTSNQVATVAVWDDCCPNCAVGTGKSMVPVIGFSNWFIEGMSNSGGPGVLANFLDGEGCGVNSANGGTATGSNAPYGIPVRLVTPNP